MINFLSVKYQKEIALTFLSLFFISGLGSLKAQMDVYSYTVLKTLYVANYNTALTSYLPKHTGAETFKKITKDRFTDFALGTAKIVSKKSNDKEPIAVKEQESKKVKPGDADRYKKLSIGGPGQPEMSAFKSVGADNMADPFTGDFSYNVPLLDVGGYPVNMFYNSGITMDQEASWLGLGWNINPGTIMRNMRGIPDDFNGTDLITKRQSIRSDKTWGLSAGAGLKFGGFPVIGIDVNAGLSFNNKLGIALEAGIHPSLSISKNAGDGKTASLSFGANLSANSRSGASLTPSVNVSLQKELSATEQRSGSIGVSYTQTSRSGITGLHLDASLSKSKDLPNRSSAGFYKYNSASGTEAALSSSISFAYPTVVPSIKNIFTRRSYNLSFSVGGEFWGLNGHGRLSGYYTENRIDEADKETRHPAYGMLNYQKANNDANAMLDFNRVNDGVYTPNSPAIAMAAYTYDVFTINGEGTGGSFRATRKDLGYMRDPYVKTREDNGSAQLDLGFGNTIHGGGEFSYAFTPSEVGGWNINNMAKNIFQFKPNSGIDQAVYFRNPGEKTIPDAAFQNAIGGESLVRLKMSNTGSGTPILLPKIIKYDATKNVIGESELQAASFVNMPRDKRTQVINFLTADEAQRVGFDKNIYSYDTDSNKIIFGAACNKTGIETIKRFDSEIPDAAYRKKHHISEIDVLGTDGRKYVYGIPVYNTKQVDVSFSIENGNITTGKSDYSPDTDDTKNNEKGRDWFMNQEEMPAYTHSFLLSALISPNYVDVKLDGITEDDMGDAIKFNYTKFNQGYQWRTPVGDGAGIAGASYSEGLKTDNKDDKAHYVYGVREMWHLYSIESKNMVARFYVKNDRLDCKQVIGQKGGLDESWGMQRLDKICLYSKGDLMKLGDKAKPIKTVKFFQSYKLCKNADNSMAGNGKLTLDSVWISYNGNQKKAKSKYVFYYPADKNPEYEYNGNDKWGNYKPASNTLNNNPGNLSNADYPYSIQDKTKADKNAASWIMNKILLPSGGVINIDFESDDYAYVQNKKAANMFGILGFGSTPEPTISQQANKFLFSPRGLEEYEYVYVQLTYPITSANAVEQKKELTARYFENTSQVYMKIAVTMPPKPGLPGIELIPVYADIDNFGIVPGTGGSVAYIKVKRVEGGSTPMVQQALQFIKQQLPGKAYPGYDVKDNSTAKAVVLALAGMITSVAALKMGEDAILKLSNTCREVATAKSFVRLTNPVLTKYGGGLRVKKVTINDNWNKMTNQYESSYGQEYKYTTTELINGKLQTISSGVAAWEPSMGGDENPHKEIMRYMNHNKGGPYDFGAIEMPLGEMFYPSPNVGYSRVEVLSIHRDTVKNLPTRQVTEFYTTKDFPFQSTCTQLTDPEANVKYEPSAIKQLLKLDMKKAITQSQGFLVDMNDMNGKVKIQATYSALDSVNAVSYTQNFYNIQKSTDKTYKFNHTFPTISKPDGIVDNSTLIGRDIELMADFRQHKTETITTNISLNFDFFFLGIFPIPLTNLLQPVVYEGTTYRSASLLKIVNHYGMLDSVVVIDKGSMVSTKNMLYDAETGNPILTRTNNEHNKPMYNFSYPAHWAYSGMGPAYKNIDVNYTGLTFRYGKLEAPGFDMNIFESGDELYVIAENDRGPNKVAPCDDGLLPAYLPKNTENRIWAVNTAKAGSVTPQMVFMDKDGNPYTAKDVTMRIIRSGHRNMLDQTVGSITSLKSPVNSTTGKLEFTDATNIIQTSAATFKDHWRVDNSFYLYTTTQEVTNYVGLKKTTIPILKTMSILGHVGFHRNIFNNCIAIKEDIQQISESVVTPYTNLNPILTRRKDLGSCDDHFRIRNWLNFDFSAFNDPAASIQYSRLNLNAHIHPKFNSQYNIHPGVHSNADPHTYRPGTVSNALTIDRMKTPWYVVSNSSAWASVYFNPSLSDMTNRALVPQTTPASNINQEANITGIVKDIVNEKNNNPSANIATGIKLQHLSEAGPTGGENRQCFSNASIDVYTLDCNSGIVPDPYNIDPLLRLGLPCKQIQNISECRSKFTKKAINPYVEGILGNWRVDTAFVYYGERKEAVPAEPVDTRTAGTIINFKKFWNFALPDQLYLNRNYSASDVWVWNSTITQYNRKGYEIENKDPLGRFNAGLYGYNQQLPVAVANNARVREIMFDGFEDYDYQTALNCIACKPHRHANFDGIESYLDTTQKHTGRYSLRIGSGNSIDLKAPVTDATEANRGYGLRIRIDSTAYTDTAVILRGSGFRGKYYNYNSGTSCSSASGAAANTLLNDLNPTIRQNEQINFGFSLPPGINYTRFAVRWEGYVQPIVSGFYSFLLSADDGFKFKITDRLGNTVLASTERWDCNWGQNNIATTNQTLKKGELYKITMDYFENRDNQFAKLTWKVPGSNSWEYIPNNQVYAPENLSLANGTVSTITSWCTKLDSVQVKGNALTDTFSLLQGRKMVLSTWVKEGGNNCKCSTYVKNSVLVSYTGNSQTETLMPSGNIIEGWQRYEAVFTVPGNATAIKVSLKNNNSQGGAPVYFDDIRLHPFNANLKSFVYHSSNLRLMSELDENNYASFYEYDDDGTLTRVKKETIKGIKTITETRSAMQKSIQ